MRHGSEPTRNEVMLVMMVFSEEADLPADTSTPGIVNVGGTATGTIGFDADLDWFQVQLETGQSYRIDLEGVPTGAGTLDDPFLHGIHDATGDLISGTADDDE